MLKKLAFASLGIALLASPLLTSADTLSDLQAQVEALLARVKALQVQGATTDATIPDDYGTQTSITTCPNLTVTMRRGARDATTNGQVTKLQTLIAKLGQ